MSIRLLASVLIYVAGIPLFWGYAVYMLGRDDGLVRVVAPEGLIKGVIKVIAAIMSVFWFALMTWELAEIIWSYRPWGQEDD